MKLLVLSAICTLFTCQAFCSQYFGVNVGTNNAMITSEEHNPKIGYKMGATYGYKFQNGFRSEFALGYKKNNFKTKYVMDANDDIKSREYRSLYSLSYMVNVIYDVSQLKAMDFSPYLGLGFGYSQNSEKNKLKTNDEVQTDKFRDNRFAYQAIVGVKYDLNADYYTCLEYCFGGYRSHCKDHSVGVSFVRNF